MATTLLTTEYLEYNSKTVGKLSIDKLFVEIYYGEGNNKQKVKLSELYIKDKAGKPAKIKSFKEFETNLAKDNIFTSANLAQKITYAPKGAKLTPKVEYKAIDVPTNFDSTSIDIKGQEVPYGLKRNLNLKGDNFRQGGANTYILIEINGLKDFVKKSDIYYYDENNVKYALTDLKSLNDLKKFIFETKDGKVIDRIYLEKQFTFDKVNAQEKIDVENQAKITYDVDDDGTITQKVTTLSKHYTEKSFATKTVDDEKNPGKTKEIRIVKVKNFELQEDGEYIAVTINNQRKMVKLTELIDENGKPLEIVNGKVDLTKYIGKTLRANIGETIYDISAITAEQALLRYNTMKVYQETQQEYSETSYIKLSNGEYVNEADTVKPVSYKLADNKNKDEYDKWLVKTKNADGSTRYVILDKDYFTKYGDTTEYKQEGAIKIKQCAPNSKDCVVCQTTSKSAEVEEAIVVKRFKSNKTDVEAQSDIGSVQAGVESNYKNGIYAINEYYNENGEPVLVDERKKRFELTDTVEYTDYADDLLEYKALKTGTISVKDSEVTGGATYDWADGCATSFSVWGHLLSKGFGVAALAGIFVPVVGPIVSAIYAVGMVAAIPGIPIVNGIIAAVKNSKKTFTDKTEYNNKKMQKQAKKDLEQLYTRMTSKEYNKLNQAGFDAEYDRIIHSILSLSDAVVDVPFSVVSGEATVTAENANIANDWVKTNKADLAKIAALEKKIEKATKAVEKAQAKIDKEKAKHGEGWIVTEKLTKDLAKAQSVLDDLNTQKTALTTKQEANVASYTAEGVAYTRSPEVTKLLEKAEAIKTVIYLKNFADSEEVQDIIKELGYSDESKDEIIKMVEQLSFDKKGNIVLDGWDINTKPELVLDADWYKEENADTKDNKKLNKAATWTRTQTILEKLKEKFKTEQQIEESETTLTPNDDTTTTTPTESGVSSVDEPVVNVTPVEPTPAPAPVESSSTTESKPNNIETIDEIKRKKLNSINDTIGATDVNANGLLRKNNKNFTLLFEKMKRLLELANANKAKLEVEDSKEYEDLKVFISSNYKYINDIIKKQGKAKTNPKYIQKDYDEFLDVRNKLMTALAKNGNVVNPDGTFLTGDDLKKEAENINLSV